MTGRINKENKTITELPTMEKPDFEKYRPDYAGYDKAHYLWSQHIKKLKTFSYSGEWKAETGDEVSFTTGYQMKSLEDECDDWVDCTEDQYKHRGTMSRRRVAIPLPDKQPDEKEDKEDILLSGPIKKLADAMEAKGVRPVFGLQPDQIKLIEETFKEQPDLFNERLWEQVGKNISWYPLTAMCWYMKHLAEAKAHKQESEETFEDFMRNSRDAFVSSINKQEWNTGLRTSAENFLICFDQMRQRLTQPVPPSTYTGEREAIANCSGHKKEVLGIADMKVLAEMISDLHYESFSHFMVELGIKVYMDSNKDYSEEREQLAHWLMEAQYKIQEASGFIYKAWQVSKRFMK